MLRRRFLYLFPLFALTFSGAAYAGEKDNTSLSLREALLSGYENRPEIRQCRENIKAAVAEIRRSFSAFLPDAEYGWQRGRREQGGSPAVIFENRELTASLPVFRGGQSLYGVKAARIVYDERVFRCKQAEQNILNETAQAHADFAFRTEILDYYETNLSALQKQAQRTRRLMNAGRAVRSDTLLAEAEQAFAGAELADARNAAEAARKKLFHLTGIEAKAAKLPEPEKILLKDADNAQNVMLAQHPQLLALRAAAEASTYAVKAQRGALLPSADINYTHSEQDQPLFFGGDLEFESYTANVRVPLFKGGANVAALKREKNLAAAAREEAEAFEISLKNTLTDTLRDYNGAAKTYEARAKGIAAAERALTGVRREYAEGLRTLTEVLQAEKDMLNYKRTAAEQRYKQASAYFTVLALTGEMTPGRFGIEHAYPAYESVFPLKGLP